MKKNIQTITIALLSLILSVMQASAQSHKNYKSSPGDALPMNRAAFIFCYNNGTSYKNPAAVILSKQSKDVHRTTSSTSEIQNNTEEKVCLFPNLTEDELWVELDNKKIQNKNLQLEIYNANGEIVYNTKIEQNLEKINVCDFTTGTFLVKIGDNVQKIIIE